MHTIQAVADRTGLTPDVIRVWERRHQAITPVRTASNQRSYTEEDIERLMLFRKLTDRGLRISNIATLSTEALQSLLQKEERIPAPLTVALPMAPNEQDAVQAALNAIIAMEAEQLESLLQRAVVDFGMVSFLTRFVAPLVVQVGEQWRNGTLRTCQEHFCSAYLRSFLGRHLLDANPTGTGPRLVVATPPGHFHELGSLMVAVVAAQQGWQVLYLGASVPAEELVFCAQLKAARALALSITYPADDEHIPALLNQLRHQLPKETAIITGGACVHHYTLPPGLTNLHQPQDLEAFADLLGRLRTS